MSAVPTFLDICGLMHHAAPLAKRAVTRKCPVCEEDIPVRLLDVHAELESERVNEIIQRIGSTEVLEQAEPDDGLTARTRRSALKARKSMSLLQPHASSSKIFSSSEATLEVIDKALKTIKRRRKQRNIKLREMTRDDEEAITGLSGYKGSRGRWAGRGEGDGTVCPVCIKVIQGDPDVVEAHVDACLVHQVTLQDAREREERERKAREAEERDSWEEIDVEGEVRIRVTDGATFQGKHYHICITSPGVERTAGMGFDVRDRSQQDVDDDVDIDGEDDVLYGNAQFTEGDILVVDGERARSSNPHTSEDDTGDSRENGVEGDMIVTLQDLVAAGKRSAPSVSGVATPVDEIVEQLQRTGDTAALIGALEARIRILVSISLILQFFSRLIHTNHRNHPETRRLCPCCAVFV